MPSIEQFLEDRRPEGVSWEPPDGFLEDLESLVGAECSEGYRAFISRFGCHDQQGELEARSSVFSANFSLWALSGEEFLRSAQSWSVSPLRDELDVPLFPLGAGEGGSLLVTGDDVAIVASRGARDPSDIWWGYYAGSLRNALDSWILPNELGRWTDADSLRLPALEVLGDVGEMVQRNAEIEVSLQQLVSELVELPELYGSDLVRDRRLLGVVYDWLDPRFVVMSHLGIRVPIHELRSRFSGLFGCASAVAVAEVCGAEIRDEVGFLGAGIGAHLNPQEARAALLELNRAACGLDVLASQYQATVAVEVNKVHRFGL